MSSTDPKTLFSKHRIEGLADAVFAIAMTLLVLEIKIPGLEPHVSAHELLAAIRGQAREFFAFAVSFALAGVFWMQQQRVFHAMRSLDRRGALLSIAPMMFVCLLPYSTGLLAHYSSNPAAEAIYFGNQFAIVGFISLLWLRTVMTGNLESIDQAEKSRFTFGILLLTFSLLAAAVAAVFSPENAWLVFIGIVVAVRVGKRIVDSRKGSRKPMARTATG